MESFNKETLSCEEYIKQVQNNAKVISIPESCVIPIQDLIAIFDITQTKYRKFTIAKEENFGVYKNMLFFSL